MLFLEVEKGRLLARLGEWMCLQSGVYLKISANPVQPVVYDCGDRRSHSTSTSLLDINFATGRVGAGAGAGLQLLPAVGSFGFSGSASLLRAI